jgi:hypothetical protein
MDPFPSNFLSFTSITCFNFAISRGAVLSFFISSSKCFFIAGLIIVTGEAAAQPSASVFSSVLRRNILLWIPSIIFVIASSVGSEIEDDNCGDGI